MKKMMMAAALAAGMGGTTALADSHADTVTLQLQWVTQAQFAGYYVALDKGFYEAEGLDVTVLAGGPDIAPPQVLAGGGADAMLNWMPSALAAREKGLLKTFAAKQLAFGSLATNTRSCHGCRKKAFPQTVVTTA